MTTRVLERVRLRETSAMAEINITPLIDVMLAVLVIFMIAMPILTQRITLDLPQRGPPPPEPPKPPEIVNLAVAADGSLTWNGAPLIAEALEPQLRLEAKRHPQPELQVEVDRRAAYQEVVTVLAAAKVAGVEKIGFKQ